MSDLTDRMKFWLRKRNHYRGCFMDDSGHLTRSGQVVIKDLASFCSAYRSTAQVGPQGVDAMASALAQGRREVWLRLQSMLTLPDAEALRALDVES